MTKNSSCYEFSITSSLEDLEKLKPEWDALHASDDNQFFFTDWRWIYCVKKHLMQDIAVTSIRVEGELIAAFALAFNEQTKTISIACSNQTDLNDCLISKDHQHDIFLKQLFLFFDRNFKQWTVFKCRPSLDHCTATSLARPTKLKSNIDPYLSNSWFDTQNVDSLKSISKKHIKNVNRLERKLSSDHGNLTFCHARTDPDSVKQFFELENNSWKGEGSKRTSILATASLPEFYLELASLFSKTNQLRLSFCQQGSTVLAGQFGLLSAGILYFLKISYDMTYQVYGVGNILLYDTLKEAADTRDIKSINLVTGPKWAERWHPQMNQVNWVKFYRPNLQGLASWNVSQLKNKVRPLVNKAK